MSGCALGAAVGSSSVLISFGGASNGIVAELLGGGGIAGAVGETAGAGAEGAVLIGCGAGGTSTFGITGAEANGTAGIGGFGSGGKALLGGGVGVAVGATGVTGSGGFGLKGATVSVFGTGGRLVAFDTGAGIGGFGSGGKALLGGGVGIAVGAAGVTGSGGLGAVGHGLEYAVGVGVGATGIGGFGSGGSDGALFSGFSTLGAVGVTELGIGVGDELVKGVGAEVGRLFNQVGFMPSPGKELLLAGLSAISFGSGAAAAGVTEGCVGAEAELGATVFGGINGHGVGFFSSGLGALSVAPVLCVAVIFVLAS